MLAIEPGSPAGAVSFPPTRRKASADVVQAEAEFKARELQYKREQDQLAKIIEQIKL